MRFKSHAICLLLFSALMTATAQVQVAVVPAPDPMTDPDIIIYNSLFERDNNKSGWIYDPASTLDPPFRDLGQTFTPSTAFYLDKIYVEISPASDQTFLDACENAPIHVDILQFDSIVEMEAPVATLTSQSGQLPATLVLGVSRYLQFDLQNIALQSGKIYGFLFKFDAMKTHRYLEVVKTEDADRYAGGKMLYTEFNGTDGRQNITIFKWKHAGGNVNRDLHFWIEKGTASSVANQATTLPAAFDLDPNYPNPFNATTQISFHLDSPSHVIVDIYDRTGRRITSLLDEQLPEGGHRLTWNGTDGRNRVLPSGVYFIRVRDDRSIAWQKMTLMR